MTEEEYKKLFEEHPFFDRMYRYMKASFVMQGDYTAVKSYTTESEAHLLSGGNVLPM